MLKAALIDLDGTLLDTVPDLAWAANRMLAELGLKLLPEEVVQQFIGQGIERLVSRCIDAAGDGSRLDEALESFSRHYERESGVRTRHFPNVTEGLAALTEQGLLLACVTNKAERFTRPLLRRCGLTDRFQAVVCGDQVARLKPAPDAFLEACGRLRVTPGEAIVIGDSRNDVVAARAAGCPVICVAYGYTEGLPMESLGCDALVEDLMDAAGYVRRLNRTTSGALS
jgi:phosphoglycolate phosphatase